MSVDNPRVITDLTFLSSEGLTTWSQQLNPCKIEVLILSLWRLLILFIGWAMPLGEGKRILARKEFHPPPFQSRITFHNPSSPLSFSAALLNCFSNFSRLWKKVGVGSKSSSSKGGGGIFRCCVELESCMIWVCKRFTVVCIQYYLLLFLYIPALHHGNLSSLSHLHVLEVWQEWGGNPSQSTWKQNRWKNARGKWLWGWVPDWRPGSHKGSRWQQLLGGGGPF